MESSSNRRASVHQLEFLARCMERFPALALSRAKSRHELENSQRKWKQIAAGLNKINAQFNKTGRGWLRYWIGLKFKVRRKYLHQRSCVDSPNLTPFDRRLLSLLTDDEGNLLSGGVGADLNGTLSNEPNDNTSTYSDTDIKPVPTEQVIITPKESDGQTTEENEDNESVGSNVQEDPIGINTKTIDKLQAKILQFKLRRQKEMHDLEIAQMKERHKLEIDILELRKKKMMQEIERMKKFTVKRQRNCT